MDTIQFAGGAPSLWIFLEGAMFMILPIVLLIVWKVKTHEKILPVVIGAVTWLAFAIILKLAPAYFLLSADNPLAKTISGSVWLTCLVAGILAGVFEETGRFLAFKIVLKKFTHRRASISYGIGHGGFESFYVGFQILSIGVIILLLNSPLSDMITASMSESELSLLTSQLAPYADVSLFNSFLGVFERIFAITIHISLSVLVFASVREKRFIWLYPFAIIIHTLFDFSIVFYQAGFITDWMLELCFAAFAAAVALYARGIYKKLKASNISA